MAANGSQEPIGPAFAESGAGEMTPRAWLRRQMYMTRKRALLIVAGLIVFVFVSFALARFLQTENVERDDDLELVEAEAHGDAQKMIALIDGCSTSAKCVAGAKADAANPRLLRRGEVKILQLESETAYSLTGATGETRFAWTVIGKLPVVQCIDIERTGSFVGGVHVKVIGLSAPIQNEADC